MARTRVEGAVFADSLFLIGQAWIKRDHGDLAGAAGDLAAAAAGVPDGTVGLILAMIDDGDLPRPDSDRMDAWLEQCRLAGAGSFTVTFHETPDGPPPLPDAFPPPRHIAPPAPAPAGLAPPAETEEAFQARLHRMVAGGTAAEEGRAALRRWDERLQGARDSLQIS